ncbi:MAG: cytochrome C oxidase subunit IV family protein [Gemmatimonadota bacterium]
MMSTDVTHVDGNPTPAHEEGHDSHPSVAFYVTIGAILAIVTGVEVAIYYMPQFEAVDVPLLVILSTMKILLVMMFFMHLKMDHRALTWIFLSGIALAAFMVSALVVLFHVVPRFDP